MCQMTPRSVTVNMRRPERKVWFCCKTWSRNNLDSSLQHPQIQKESQYIKYVCCDDAWTMNLWVTGIRIAKVHSTLSPVFINRKQSAWPHALPCVSCTPSTVRRCTRTIKPPRGRLLSALRGPTAALRRAPIHQRPRPPSKVSTAHTRAAPFPRLWNDPDVVTRLYVHAWRFLLLCQLKHQARPTVTLPSLNQDLFQRYSHEGRSQ